MNKLVGYMHGVNLGGCLSQCDHTKERYDNFIKEAKKKVKEGFEEINNDYDEEKV